MIQDLRAVSSLIPPIARVSVPIAIWHVRHIRHIVHIYLLPGSISTSTWSPISGSSLSTGRPPPWIIILIAALIFSIIIISRPGVTGELATLLIHTGLSSLGLVILVIHIRVSSLELISLVVIFPGYLI